MSGLRRATRRNETIDTTGSTNYAKFATSATDRTSERADDATFATRPRVAWWLDPARLFAVLAIPLGLVYALLTPPFQVPDELRHLRRVVQIAYGGVTGGTDIPASIDEFAKRAQADRRPRARVARRAFSIDKLRELAAMPLEPERAVHFAGDRTLPYSPVVYLPAVAAVGVGRAVGARPLALLYLARLALLAGGVALVWWALRLTPALAWPLCLLALLPMTTFLRSGLTADTMTTGCALLFFALMLRAWRGAGPLSTSELVALTAAGCVLALCKQGYLPLTLGVLGIPRERFATPRTRLVSLALMLGVPLLVSALWLASLDDWMWDNPRRANPDVQLRMLLENPRRFVEVLGATWLTPGRIWRLADTFVGRLLLLSVRPPTLVVVLCLATLVALIAGDATAPSARIRERLLLLGAVLACIVVISLGAWIKWSTVGGAAIHGIQGRYLHPLVPFVALALVPPRAVRWRCSARTAALLVVVVVGIANAVGLAGVVAATWAASR
ncbi:MAG TPA: DUF2142 domain-containing protein [Candidatus Binatia bacterium]